VPQSEDKECPEDSMPVSQDGAILLCVLRALCGEMSVVRANPLQQVITAEGAECRRGKTGNAPRTLCRSLRTSCLFNAFPARCAVRCRSFVRARYNG